MSKIVLNDVTNLNALSVINDNFDKLEQELQNKVLYRDNPEGEPNGLEGDLDANGNSLYNVQDLTITGSFSVNGKDIETVIDDAVQGIEDNAIAAENAATAAGISAASANTSAIAAAASASTASTKASEASTSASNAASSATAAASSASTATTQAGIATTKASEASASASAAATSASSASTSASTATTQAGIATTQATNAASSASSASTSATSAANSAAAAATALDSFDDRYLGSKSSDPTVDNDGNALLTGALYYSTTTQSMKVYDGANWITATAAGTTAMNVYKYVATAGQTTFSGTAAVGGTMSYTSGNIIVFVNGVSLDSTDYTATNGTSVVLGSAAALNDEVVVVAFKSFTVADTYTQSAADAQFLPKANPSYTGTLTGGTGVVNLGSGQFYKDASGNVGIGTVSFDGNWAPKFQVVSGANDGTGGIMVESYRPSLIFKDNSASAVRQHIVADSSALLFGSGDASFTERARIDSSGNLLVGTTTAYAKTSINSGSLGAAILSLADGTFDAGNYGLVQVTRPATNDTKFAYSWIRNGNAIGGIGFAQSSNTAVFINGATNANNGMTLAPGGTSWGTQSDERKKNILGNIEDALSKVATLRTVFFEYKNDEKQVRRVGFIAQDVQAVLPEAVHVDDDEDNTLNLQYSDVIPLLTKAIQEQQALITTLTERVAALEGAQQ